MSASNDFSENKDLSRDTEAESGYNNAEKNTGREHKPKEIKNRKRNLADQVSGGSPPRGIMTVDREVVCPFLIRVFNVGSKFYESDITRRLNQYQECSLYAWKDMTLREVISILSEQIPEAASSSARTEIRKIVCENDRTLRYRTRLLGVVYNYKRSRDDDLCFGELKFVPGDGFLVSVSSDYKNNSRKGSGKTGSWSQNYTSHRGQANEKYYSNYHRKHGSSHYSGYKDNGKRIRTGERISR